MGLVPEVNGHTKEWPCQHVNMTTGHSWRQSMGSKSMGWLRRGLGDLDNGRQWGPRARAKPSFEGMDPFASYRDPNGGRMEDPTGTRKAQACARSFDGTGSLSEFLTQFQSVAELNGWIEKEKWLYLGVSLDGSTLKLLEKVDASSKGGFTQLVSALQQCYQPADQISLYWTQLLSK